ncbi:MAG: family 43 glycosylhydrolase [Epulopiscium sp.]|mgnify:CR=1 FL=1|nr:family 43 glycosylhydrolase [Candidatus Epulonipiscium sp.]
MKKQYNNPVLPGFHPDPSVIRVGEDYYMVNSTFQYFPAITISHSKDLVNWEYIGHAITENEYLDLTGIYDSHGIWAPDISYYEGTYYIFVTLRLNGDDGEIRQNLVMTSQRPEGPYSKPIILDRNDGMDPSHFIDDDGTHYMVVHPGVRIMKLNDECTEVVEGPITLWEGTGREAPEGPHLLKKGEYYYAILAEGGTGYGHCITVARSKNLLGPYEPCPFNPVHTQKDPEAKLQRAGHGKLVQTQNGEWWVTYLGGRTNEGRYTTLGRETFLDPVQWTEDGWFTVNEGKGPSEQQYRPNLPEVTYPDLYFDDFDEEKLGLQWEFVRNPDKEFSLTERPGYARIWTQAPDLNTIQARNTLVRREQHHHYEATVKMEFDPSHVGQQAGLTCYYDTRCFIKFYLTYDDGLKIKLMESRATNHKEIAAVGGITQKSIYLKVRVEKQTRHFMYSYDNVVWYHVGTIEDCSFLSDEGTGIRKAHTGTLVGLYANHGISNKRIAADFDWFKYEPLDNI